VFFIPCIVFGFSVYKEKDCIYNGRQGMRTASRELMVGGDGD
jgi:hypothetical protein